MSSKVFSLYSIILLIIFYRNRERPVYVNLSKIVERVKKGRLDNSKIITIKDLYEANLFKKTTYGVKILSRVISIENIM